MTHVAITRVTHSCHLIEIGGKTILTDPWFTKKEHYDQGEPIAFTIDELPALDAVLITHAHDDHCDLDAFRSYRDLAVPLIVAPSVEDAARDAGFTDIFIAALPAVTTDGGRESAVQLDVLDGAALETDT